MENDLQADTNVEIFFNALSNTEYQHVKYIAGIGCNPNSIPKNPEQLPIEVNSTETNRETDFSFLDEVNNIVESSKKGFNKLKRMISQADLDKDFPQLVNQLKDSIIDKFHEFDIIAEYTGTGISERIQIGYKWLAQTYQPDDRIYIFGFSRGAYTARSLVSLISLYGLPSAEDVADDNLVTEVYNQYRNSKKSYTDPAHSPNPIIYTIPPIHFLGVWDTVGALGQSVFGMHFNFERFDNSFHDVNLQDNIHYAYHALAMDDIRSSFLPTLFYRPENWKGIDLEQVWFRGAHADIGGGYGDRRLANISLLWMVEKARVAGLQFNNDTLVNYPVSFDQLKMHNEYKGKLKFAVSWPRWVPTTRSTTDQDYNQSMGYLHPSVFELSQLYSNDSEWKITELLNVGDSVELTIDSRKEWNPTGLILLQGNSYRIKARGKVFDFTRETDANGWYDDDYIHRKFPRRIQEANWMELCGIVALQPQIRELNRNLLDWLKVALVEDPIEFRKLVFRIGKEKSIIVKESGFLWLFLNDNWATYGNNKGEMNIKITRES